MSRDPLQRFLCRESVISFDITYQIMIFAGAEQQQCPVFSGRQHHPQQHKWRGQDCGSETTSLHGQLSGQDSWPCSRAPQRQLHCRTSVPPAAQRHGAVPPSGTFVPPSDEQQSPIICCGATSGNWLSGAVVRVRGHLSPSESGCGGATKWNRTEWFTGVWCSGQVPGVCLPCECTWVGQGV